MAPDVIEVSDAKQDDRPAWEAFTAREPGAEAGQRWEFLDLLEETFGQRTHRLVARRAGTVLAILPLVEQKSFLGHFLTSVPYLNYAGVLGRDPDARRSLAEHAVALAKQRHADRLEIRGRNGADLPVDPWSGKASYVLDLPATTDELWSAIGTKLRTRVRRPQKNGYNVRIQGPGAASEFYPCLARRWHELGSPVLPLAFFTGLERVFGNDVTYVFADKSGTTVAAGFLLRTGERIEIPWGASHGEHDSQGVNMLLYWNAFEHTINAGARLFDFGRSTPGSGTAAFKLQWGAKEVPLEWNVWASGARGRSTESGDQRRGLAAAAWRKLPHPVTLRVGPYLAARIPL